MSLKMLKEAQKQGITDVVNIFHYQHPKMIDKNTSFSFIMSEVNKLQKIKLDNINIKIHAASSF